MRSIQNACCGHDRDETIVWQNRQTSQRREPENEIKGRKRRYTLASTHWDRLDPTSVSSISLPSPDSILARSFYFISFGELVESLESLCLRYTC